LPLDGRARALRSDASAHARLTIAPARAQPDFSSAARGPSFAVQCAVAIAQWRRRERPFHGNCGTIDFCQGDPMAEPIQPVFTIDKLYVKDLSVEIPNAPQIFLEREQPKVDLQIQNGAHPITDGVYEAFLTATITAKIGEKTMFLIEVTQAGIFQIRNLGKEDMDVVMGVGCPNILYPYLREVVSDAATRAGFMPVVLAPMNFEALYVQRMQQTQAEANAPAGHA
jgi:preprotein translocase subunit SecB